MDSEVAYEYDPEYNSHQQSHDDYDADEDESVPLQPLPPDSETVASHHRAIPLEVYEIHPSTTVARTQRETPIDKVNRLKKEADALYSKLLESVTEEMDQETQTMFVHLSTVFGRLEQVTPVAEAIAANGPLTQTQSELLNPQNPRGKRLIKKIAKFKKYAEKSSSPNPFIRDSALQTSPTVTATQVYNIMYAKQDEDEFLPDLNILDQRVTNLETSIGASLPQPINPSRQRAISTSSTPSRLQPSSPPLLPTPIRQTPRRRPSLNTSLSEATTHLTQLLQKLSTQQETPTMETLMTNISNLQKSQKTLKETPLPSQKKKKNEWQVVSTPSNRRSKKQDLLANMPPLTASQQSVQRLHESVYPLDRLIGFVPVLVERLESLTPIHTRGAMLSDALSGVISNHKGSLQDLEMLEGLAGMIDANLTENSKVCARNWESFDVRIKELERRLNGKNVHVRV